MNLSMSILSIFIFATGTDLLLYENTTFRMQRDVSCFPIFCQQFHICLIPQSWFQNFDSDFFLSALISENNRALSFQQLIIQFKFYSVQFIMDIFELLLQSTELKHKILDRVCLQRASILLDNHSSQTTWVQILVLPLMDDLGQIA